MFKYLFLVYLTVNFLYASYEPDSKYLEDSHCCVPYGQELDPSNSSFTTRKEIVSGFYPYYWHSISGSEDGHLTGAECLSLGLSRVITDGSYEDNTEEIGDIRYYSHVTTEFTYTTWNCVCNQEPPIIPEEEDPAVWTRVYSGSPFTAPSYCYEPDMVNVLSYSFSTVACSDEQTMRCYVKTLACPMDYTLEAEYKTEEECSSLALELGETNNVQMQFLEEANSSSCCIKLTPLDNNSTDNNSTDNNSTDNNSTDNNSTDNNIEESLDNIDKNTKDIADNTKDIKDSLDSFKEDNHKDLEDIKDILKGKDADTDTSNLDKGISEFSSLVDVSISSINQNFLEISNMFKGGHAPLVNYSGSCNMSVSVYNRTVNFSSGLDRMLLLFRPYLMFILNLIHLIVVLRFSVYVYKDITNTISSVVSAT